MIQIDNKEQQLSEHSNYLFIYDPEFKILEVTNGQLWNAPDSDHCIAVDVNRLNNGDYVPSDELVEKYEAPETDEEETDEDIEEDEIEENL